MVYKIERSEYVAMYGPTTGDKIRLADTDLFIEVESDKTTYGEEVKFGGGKVIRDGMGQSQLCSDSVVDLVITNALIIDPELAKKHVLSMVKNQAINCLSGKQIHCEIDSVCIHGDNESSLATAKSIRDNLVDNGLELKPLNKMDKFN